MAVTAWQGVHVGAEQLLQPAELQYAGHNLAAPAQGLEHLLAGDVLPALGLLGLVNDLQAVEEHLAHLLGRRDVELRAGQAVDRLLHVARPGGEYGRRLGQRGGVEPDAIKLHRGQHGHQRHLHFAEQPVGAHAPQLRLKAVLEPQGHVGVFGGVVEHLLGRHVAH